MAKLTGKAGSATSGNTTLYIRSWTANVNLNLADSTDSADYNTNTTTLFRSALPTKVQCDGSIQYWYDPSVHKSAIHDIATSANTVTLSLKTDANTTAVTFAARLSDFTLTTPVDGIIEGTANYQSSGPITFA